jgi:CheY-like chemotaxis protein
MPEATDFSGLTVLVVVPDDDERNLYKFFLETCHARVVTLSTAGAALHYLGFAPVDVIVAESSALGVARRTFMRAVRTLPKCTDLPIIAITAWPLETTAAGDGYGVSVMLLKPVHLDEIAATIERLVRGRDAA